MAQAKEEQRRRERGELTQRLTYILLFCWVEPQGVTDLVNRVGGAGADIRSAIKLLTGRHFIEESRNNGKVFKTTEAGVQWMTTQVKQYHSMFGLPYIKKPPGLFGEEAVLKLKSIVPGFREGQSLVTTIAVEMTERCLIPVGEF